MSRRLRSSSGFATVGVAFVVVAGSVLALAGVGPPKSRFDFGSGFAWLTSAETSDAVLVNGADGKPSARLLVPGGKGAMSVEQRDGHSYLMVDGDGDKRELYRLDDASLTPGPSLSTTKNDHVVRGGDKAYLVNDGDGVVQPIDAESLDARGAVLKFNGPIVAVADDEGWLVVVTVGEATVSVVADGAAGEPVSVGTAGDDVRVSTIGGRPVVVNVSKGEVTTFEGRKVAARILLPAGSGELLVPDKGEGDRLVLMRRNGDKGELLLVGLRDGATKVVDLGVSVFGMRAPLATPDAVFLVDPGAGAVVTVDPLDGSVRSTVDAGVGKGEGNVESFVKDGILWINNPHGSKARVIDKHGDSKTVNKYDEKVPVINPPPESPDQPPDVPTDPNQLPQPPAPPTVPSAAAGPVVSEPPATQPPPPVANAPGKPNALNGTAGNKSVSLTWAAPSSGGSPIEKYRLVCSPDCGTGTEISVSVVETFTIEGLKNGGLYDFELSAINSVGEGPAAKVSSIQPTGDVPAKPTAVKATADDKGQVKVDWLVDNEGLALTGFKIVATSNSATVVTKSVSFDVTDAKAVSYTTKPDALGYDLDAIPDWQFKVKALGTKDAKPVESPDSDPSPPVDPYRFPSWDGTQTVTVTGVGDGTAAIRFPLANEHGRVVTYAIERCEGVPSTCIWVIATTSSLAVASSSVTTQVSGLQNLHSYAFRVTATNAAGPSAKPITSAAAAATPSAPPPTNVKVTITRVSFSKAHVTASATWAGRTGVFLYNGSTFPAGPGIDVDLPTGGDASVTVTACVDEIDASSCAPPQIDTVDMRAPTISFSGGGQNGCSSSGVPRRTGGTWAVGWTINAHGIPSSQFSNGNLTEVYSDGSTFPKTWNADTLQGSTGGWGDVGYTYWVNVSATVQGLGDINARWNSPGALRCPYP